MTKRAKLKKNGANQAFKSHLKNIARIQTHWLLGSIFTLFYMGVGALLPNISDSL